MPSQGCACIPRHSLAPLEEGQGVPAPRAHPYLVGLAQLPRTWLLQGNASLSFSVPLALPLQPLWAFLKVHRRGGGLEFRLGSAADPAPPCTSHFPGSRETGPELGKEAEAEGGRPGGG